MEDYIVSIYYIGVCIAFFLLIFDYILLNLKMGVSLSPILRSIFQVENMIMFLGFSIGSWLTIFMFIFGDNKK